MHIITRTAISSQHLKGVGFIKNNLVKKWDIIILSEILFWEEEKKRRIIINIILLLHI